MKAKSILRILNKIVIQFALVRVTLTAYLNVVAAKKNKLVDNILQLFI